MSDVKVIINGTTDISELIESVSLTGDTSKFNRTCNVSIAATLDGRTRNISLEEGAQIRFMYEGITRFVGVIFSQDISSDGNLSITAYDTNIYLAKSNDTRIFTNQTASNIVRILAQDFGIAIGDIADTGFIIPYLRLSNVSLYDMILKALTITYNQTGRQYFVGNNNGLLTLRSGGGGERYLFEDGKNLISASYSRSIDDTKTQVKVIGGPQGKETTVISKDDVARAKYGVLQAVEELDEKATPNQVKQRADTLLKEQSVVAETLSIETLGVAEVDVGTAVYVANALTRTAGAYYVTDVSHDFNSGPYTMSLSLSRTLDLPDIIINDDEVNREEAV